MNIAYKIVQRTVYDKLLSYNCDLAYVKEFPEVEDVFCLEYIPGEIVKPKLENSKLFSFADLDSAVKFLRGDHSKSVEIWTCEVDEFNPINLTVGSDRYQKFDLWKDKAFETGGIEFGEYTCYVKNCILSNTIKLLEKIEFREKKND